MSAVDRHAEAHRLKSELGYGARRIGRELGISRYAAERLLARPLPAPAAARAAEPADAGRPVAEPVGRAVTGVAEAAVQGQTVAEPVPDDLNVRPTGPWLRLNLSRRPRLWRDLMTLLRMGQTAPVVVDVAVQAFAHAYHQALIRGELHPGQPYEVQTRVRAVACHRQAA